MPVFFELRGDAFGFLDRYRADQDRLALLVAVLDLLGDRLEFLVLALEIDVVMIVRIIGRLVGMTITSRL